MRFSGKTKILGMGLLSPTLLGMERSHPLQSGIRNAQSDGSGKVRRLAGLPIVLLKYGDPLGSVCPLSRMVISLAASALPSRPFMCTAMIRIGSSLSQSSAYQ
jgi:hypothetical protein